MKCSYYAEGFNFDICGSVTELQSTLKIKNDLVFLNNFNFKVIGFSFV